ncbi:unnamed protein product, partial [Oikopleura dioica]
GYTVNRYCNSTHKEMDPVR